jgi:hypothetical protein
LKSGYSTSAKQVVDKTSPQTEYDQDIVFFSGKLGFFSVFLSEWEKGHPETECPYFSDSEDLKRFATNLRKN